MFYVAARELAGQVTGDDLRYGRIYPDLVRIRAVSARIATAVADIAFQRGLTDLPKPPDLAAHVRSAMFDPHYPAYV
jgi:malate dehydrogenase (oxaloacetate-decarboxylating)(NADP+)